MFSPSAGNGAPLATFTYDDNGVPTSVQVGSNPQTAPRYYYVHNGHGDVVTVADASGNVMASYSYDEFGVPLSSSESFPGWVEQSLPLRWARSGALLRRDQPLLDERPRLRSDAWTLYQPRSVGACR